MARTLHLDIFDYLGNKVCSLYDNKAQVSGQATDVFVRSERNGWKELSFKIPSMCEGSEGQEKNYRLDYLISEYKVRLIDDYETDWYIISENSVSHSGFSADVDVVCKHVSTLLKHKNLDLEFSDEEGNNVGTAKELLNTILEGTEWHPGTVYNFVETDYDTLITLQDGHVVYDTKEKVRTLVAPARTGAFKLIEDMCALFDAKPLYHAEGLIGYSDEIEDKLRQDRLRLFEPYKPDGYNGNVNLSNRYIVPQARFLDAGWSFIGEYGTVFSLRTTITNHNNQKCVITYTPIDEMGRVLTPAEAQQYVQLLQEQVYNYEFTNLLNYDFEKRLLHYTVVTQNTSEEQAAQIEEVWALRLQSSQESWDVVRANNGFFGDRYLDPAKLFFDISQHWVNPYMDEERGYTVDIVPINPFSEDIAEGQLPSEVASGVRETLELHYGRNISGITRTLNTENLATKFYAYGSYGDKNGLCSLQTCKHEEYLLTDATPPTDAQGNVKPFTRTYPAGTQFRFTDRFGGVMYFTCDNPISTTDKITYSALDFASRNYVYHEMISAGFNAIYRISKTPNGSYIVLDYIIKFEQNYVPFLLNFNYFDQVGLLSDEAFNYIAVYQRFIPNAYKNLQSINATLTTKLGQLSELANSQNGFLKLAVSGYTAPATPDGTFIVNIDKTQGDNGVLYRSDYMNAIKRYFSWYVTSELKPNGDPAVGSPSMLLIIHDTTPVTWDTLYLKQINNIYDVDAEGNILHPGNYYYQYSKGTPELVKVFGDLVPTATNSKPVPEWSSTDKFYLFAADTMSGTLGYLRLANESEENMKIKTATSTEIEDHPLYYVNGHVIDKNGIATECQGIPSVDSVKALNQFGWYYKQFPYNKRYIGVIGQPYNAGSFVDQKIGFLYMCGPKDTAWHRVYISYRDRTNDRVNGDYVLDTTSMKMYVYNGTSWSDFYASSGEYTFNIDTKQLYIYSGSTWVQLDSVDDQRLARSTSEVYSRCLWKDRLFKGEYEEYVYSVSGSNVPSGRYLIDTGYEYYWAFEFAENAQANKLRLNTAKKHIYRDNSDVMYVKAATMQKDVVTKTSDNELNGYEYSNVIIDKNTGTDSPSTTYMSSPRIAAYPGYTYTTNLPENSYIVFYDGKDNYRGYSNITSSIKTFVVPQQTTSDYSSGYKPDAKYMRICTPTSSNKYNVHISNNEKLYFLNNKDTLPYTLLDFSPDQNSALLGLNAQMKKFSELADDIYLNNVKQQVDLQNSIKDEDTKLSKILGDMLREGAWQDNSYVSGDEDRLYNDALDHFEKLGKPETSYSINFLDLYNSNQQAGYSVDLEDQLKYNDEPDWPDIHDTDAAHLVDPELGINCWAYFDRIDKCYDKPWQTTIEINTNLTMMGQHDFTDMMTRIAEVTKELKAKQVLYDSTSEAVSPVKVDPGSAAALVADKLIGMINLNTSMLNGSMSSWRTDRFGRLIFEDELSEHALILSGEGLGVSWKKNDTTGEWEYITAITGEGINANAIAAGEIYGSRITAGSITADRLSSTVGHDLDIASNTALHIYATVDGQRPSGSLKTTDSVIEIAAGTDPQNPAHINISSGGVINISSGGVINIWSLDAINLGQITLNDELDDMKNKTSTAQQTADNAQTAANNAQTSANNAQQTANSKSQTWYAAPGQMEIGSKAYHVNDYWVCTTDSSNFKKGWQYLCKSESNKNKTTWLNDWELTGAASITGAKMSIDAQNGTISLTAQNSITAAAGGSINIAAGGTVKITTSGIIKIGNVNTDTALFEIGADGTGNSARSYIRNGKTSYSEATNDGVYIGTDGIGLGKGKFYVTSAGALKATSADIEGKITATSGSFTGTVTATSGAIGGWTLAANRLSSGSGTSYVALDSGTANVSHRIWAGNSAPGSAPFSVTSAGALHSISGDIGGFTIGATNIRNGKDLYNDSKDGVYIGTDGIGLGKGKFYVTTTGALTATDANIKGTITATNSSFSGSITASTISIGNNFSVDSSGVLSAAGATISGTITAESGEIGGWKITGLYIGNASALKDTTCGIYGSANPDMPVFYAGHKVGGVTNFFTNSKFAVKATGTMRAKDGEIAGFKFNETALYTGTKTLDNTVSGIYIGSDGISVGRPDGSTAISGYANSFKIDTTAGTLKVAKIETDFIDMLGPNCKIDGGTMESGTILTTTITNCYINSMKGNSSTAHIDECILKGCAISPAVSGGKSMTGPGTFNIDDSGYIGTDRYYIYNTDKNVTSPYRVNLQCNVTQSNGKYTCILQARYLKSGVNNKHETHELDRFTFTW